MASCYRSLNLSWDFQSSRGPNLVRVTTPRDTLRDTSPFGRLWPEALVGEAIIERFLRGNSSFKSSPVALMRALLVQTWRPFGANDRDPAVGWALGTLFPEFDELARPIKCRINHAAIAALPISFRPALLAGLAHAIAHPPSRRHPG